jgi:hypothetical protein
MKLAGREVVCQRPSCCKHVMLFATFCAFSASPSPHPLQPKPEAAPGIQKKADSFVEIAIALAKVQVKSGLSSFTGSGTKFKCQPEDNQGADQLR